MVADHRPVAQGYKRTPLLEAVIDVTFDTELPAETADKLREILAPNYASFKEDVVRQFHIDLETETASIQPQRAIYRFIGKDSSEVALLRPNGFAASQLAPYRCWEDLFSRFENDTNRLVQSADIKPSRIATRFINRIDVPEVDGIAPHEDYLEVHIHLPDAIADIGAFQLGFQLYRPESKVEIVIQSTVVPPAIEGVASFTLDIDVARSKDLPTDWAECLKTISTFREIKNYYYQTLLTRKALEEFE